jgi:hypothetical protein
MRHCLLLRVLLCALVGLVLRVSGASATTYYAQAGGTNRTCSTESTTPISGLAAGIGCLSGGDTLILKDGTYGECINDTIPSGSANAPTVLKAEHPPASLTAQRQVHINGNPGPCVAAVVRIGTNAAGGARAYITLDGLWVDVGVDTVGFAVVGYGGVGDTDGTHHLTLQNMELSGGMDTGSVSSFSLMISQPGNGHDMIVRNTYIHDFGLHRTHPDVPPGEQGCTTYGMYISGWNNLFENNEMEHGCGFGIHGYSPSNHFYNNIIRNNYFHDMGAAVLMMCGSPQPNYVYNNIVARTGVLIGVTAANQGQWGGITTGPSCSGQQPNNNYIYNNTLVNIGAAGELRCIALSEAGGVDSGNNTVRNNLCAYTTPSTSEGLSNTSGGAATNTLDHNFCASSGANCNIVDTPQFVTTMPSASTDFRTAGIRPTDFQLQSGSAALNAGLCDVSSMATDFSGQSRPQPTGTSCDLGAWEMGGTGGGGLPLPAQLYLYWKFDEASGSTAADSATHDPPLHPGTLTTNPAPGHVAARVGPQGLRLPGTGAYVSTTLESWPANQDVTLAFWVNIAAWGDSIGIGLATGSPNLLGVCVGCTSGATSSVIWQYGAWAGTGTTGSMYSSFLPYIGQWAYIVVGAAGNGSEGRLWINGQRKATATPLSAPTTPMTNVAFEAGRWNNPSGVVNGPGTIDDLRLYTQFLNDADVMALYRSTAGRVRHTVDGR